MAHSAADIASSFSYLASSFHAFPNGLRPLGGKPVFEIRPVVFVLVNAYVSDVL